ncbi:hypothetical protein GCK72_007960 [Caenorhabditis remanei]|uniref:DUF38 domain-containing protein n=1 Tax=Caenorhabditis remanei TaxID=31234 RepID=A0A6A5HKH4_CAERE|nr:hypothetical protein GCK72_007960 [Caenorhabditis remanei]KAF1767999.1 hypothetical protein GCK72_007960 [Caenorhabditis remanei]
MPSTPLSYPALKCVLENLEAVKRFQVVSRSPSLKKVDKAIPLRIELLKNHGKKWSINGLQLVEYGYEYWLENSNKKKKEYSRVPEDPISFPLKKLCTEIVGPSTFDHPVVKSVEILKIRSTFEGPINNLECIKKLTNQTIIFTNLEWTIGDTIEIVELVRYLVEKPEEIKTDYIILTNRESYLSETFSKLENAFGQFIDELEEVKERFISDQPRFSIPTNSNSNLHIYGVDRTGHMLYPYHIVIKKSSAI